jgi:hypothetical protein
VTINLPPNVGPIHAELVVPVTTYTVTASDPEGDQLTYVWTFTVDSGPDCGVKGSSGNKATWSHLEFPPDNCPHPGTDHPFTVRVSVSDGHNAPVTRIYHGTETGTGPGS